MPPVTIPADFLKPVGESDAQYATRLEVAAILAQGMYQEFNDPKNTKPLWQPEQLKTGAILPSGWQLVDRDSQPIQHFSQVKSGESVKDSKNRTHEEHFGGANSYPFSLAIPKGFRILNITNNTDQHSSGYDAVALYNDHSRELFIVNSGLNGNAKPDRKAVLADGGAQIAEAQAFLTASLGKLNGQSPSHITLAGHSLGAILATAQAVQLEGSTPHTPYNLITFDSIGSAPYIKSTQVSSETLSNVEKNALVIVSNGKLEPGDAIKMRLAAIASLHPFRSVSAHQFPDVLANPDSKATVIHYSEAKHDMQYITPRVEDSIASDSSFTHGLPSPLKKNSPPQK